MNDIDGGSAERIVDLDVVIVTYGRSDLVRECLDSLESAKPRIPIRVSVVDNNSPDDTPAMVEREFPNVLLTRRSGNDGFAVANNVVLRESAAAYVLLLNPDTRVEPGTIDHLIEVLERETDVGMIGCRLLTADGSPDHAAKRSIPTLSTAAHYFLLRALGRTGSAYVRPDITDDTVADVDAVNGAFMLVRREALAEVGPLDERYWMYAEDLDWCVRFRNTGWRVVYDGSVIAHHLKGGSSSGPRRVPLNYQFHRSMALFYLRHLRSRSVVVDVLVVAAIWSRFGVSVVVNAMSRGAGRLRAVAVGAHA
ncbi:glycosyltransferase family 2 protein [Agromyces subbeticus]|uniref:glycosyltransferase family 2 protein n=1 Tax=Agromyces subbeticus TaxID=293890 RepID=UPI0003B625E8|nr:glycosyltransferase family 2 protein [Agromyces subbeticus]